MQLKRMYEMNEICVFKLQKRSPMLRQRILLPLQETQGMWVRSLGQEDPPEEELATHSIILAWKIPWTEEPGRLRPWGHRVRRD